MQQYIMHVDQEENETIFVMRTKIANLTNINREKLQNFSRIFCSALILAGGRLDFRKMHLRLPVTLTEFDNSVYCKDY